MEDGRHFIEIKMSRCRLYFTERELIDLLATSPTLWTLALKRGKAFQRANTAKKRNVKKRGIKP